MTPQEALDLGWSVIPTRANKRPFFEWKKYQESRPSFDDLHRWEQEHDPAGWAGITGLISNVVTLDFDGAPGCEMLERLGLNPHRRTPSGGYHVDFVHPGWRVKTLNGKAKDELGIRWPGLDIRADGGYVLLCGKTDKGEYSWLREPQPEPLSILPVDLRDFLGLLHPPDPPVIATKTAQAFTNGNGYHDSPRVDSEKLLGDALARIGPEGRNNGGFWLATQLRDNGYSQAETESVMREYRSRCPATNTKGQREPYTEYEMVSTVRKAFEAPAREPWTRSKVNGRNGSGATAYQEPKDNRPSELPLDDLVEQRDDSEPIESDQQPEPERKTEPSAKGIPYPKPIGEEGYYGVIGKIVKAIEPHTEADPNFLLVNLLVAAGNYLDHKAYIEVSGVRHYTNLFVCGVGTSGTGRKGTAMANTLMFLKHLEDSYSTGETSCIERSSLSSGEGIVARIKDPVWKPGKEPGELELEDPGRSDKRVISIQDELGPALQNMKRTGNSLSGILRTAWDGGDLGSLTKSPYRATNPHVSMITGITREELLGGIDAELTNGFANRFLWCCSKQSKMLPEGGRLHEVNLEPYVSRFMNARRYAESVGLVLRDEEANDYWGYNDSPKQGLYAELNRPRVGKFAKCVTRVHVMVLRMALILALLDYRQAEDGSLLPCEIRREHLLAAAEVWRYCEDSARYIFGESTGDEMADAILNYLRSIRPKGATRTEISQKVFQKNKKAEEINAALSHLLNDYESPLLDYQDDKSPGAKRPTKIYRAL
jgi:hypothetical protein